MRWRKLVGAAAGLAVALGCASTAAADLPPGAQPLTKDLCKDNGYAAFVLADYSQAFPNQGQCVDASNHGAYYVRELDNESGVVRLQAIF